MKYQLLEKKFVLREQRYLLDEKYILMEAGEVLSADQQKIKEAIPVVLEKLDDLIKENEDSTYSNKLRKIADDLEKVLTANKVTRTHADDIGVVKNAVRAAHNAIKPLGDDIEANSKLGKALLNLNKLQSKPQLVGDGVDNQPINDSAWLATAMDTKAALEKAIAVAKDDDGVKKSQRGFDQMQNSVALDSITKSLKIIASTIGNIKAPENLQAIASFLNDINKETNLKSAEVLEHYYNRILEINKNIKANESDEDKEKASNNINWIDEYESYTDKKIFWEKYFKEYWLPKGDALYNAVKGYGEAFKNECLAWGFTGDKEHGNPMIKIILDLYRQCDNFIIPTGYYSMLHSSFYKAGINKKQLDSADINFIVKCKNLYSKKAGEAQKYLDYWKNAIRSSYKLNELVGIFLQTKEGTKVNAPDEIKIIFACILKPLSEIDRALEGMSDTKEFNASDEEYAKLIKYIKENTHVRNLASCIYLIADKFGDSNTKETYTNKYAGDIDNAKVKYTDGEKFIDGIKREFGRLDTADAKELITKLEDLAKKPTP